MAYKFYRRRHSGNEHESKNDKREMFFDERNVPEEISQQHKNVYPQQRTYDTENEKCTVRHPSNAGNKRCKCSDDWKKPC